MLMLMLVLVELAPLPLWRRFQLHISMAGLLDTCGVGTY